MIKNLKPFAALCVAAGLAFGLAGCGDKKTDDGQTDGKTLVLPGAGRRYDELLKA